MSVIPEHLDPLVYQPDEYWTKVVQEESTEHVLGIVLSRLVSMAEDLKDHELVGYLRQTIALVAHLIKHLEGNLELFPGQEDPMLGPGLERLAAEKDQELLQGSLFLELEHLLNRYSAENESDTPDFILAEYLLGCLSAFDRATRKRSQWYGCNCQSLDVSLDHLGRFRGWRSRTWPVRLRWLLLIPGSHKWNGWVRDFTAWLER